MIRLLPLAVLLLALLVSGGVAIVPASSESSTPSGTASATPTVEAESATPSATPEATPTPSATAPAITPGQPVPTPVPGTWTPPEGYGGPLRPEMWVQITGTDSCLNARVVPGLETDVGDGTKAPVAVLNCLPDGFVGRLSGGTWFGPQEMPQLVDDHWWWHMLGQGWMAEEWLAPVSEEGFPYPPRPELASAGLIAYVNAGDVWVMNADGSSPRMIRDLQENTSWVTALRWSPDGTRLAVAVEVSGSAEWVKTIVLTPDGTQVGEYSGIMDPMWSPDGARFAAIRATEPGGLSGYIGGPVILDLATGAETAIPSGWPGITSPAWSPDGSSVALICRAGTNYVYDPITGQSREERKDCPVGEGLQVVAVATLERRLLLPMSSIGESYFAVPNWAPGGHTIALSMGGLQAACQGYVLVSAADGGIQQCFTLPEPGASPQRCGGSLDAGATDWSADGRLFVYHWQYRQGANGVSVTDMWSGERVMIPSMDASAVSLSEDGQHLVFSGSGHVWVANTDGSGLTLLAAGLMPAWQPVS